MHHPHLKSIAPGPSTGYYRRVLSWPGDSKLRIHCSCFLSSAYGVLRRTSVPPYSLYTVLRALVPGCKIWISPPYFLRTRSMSPYTHGRDMDMTFHSARLRRSTEDFLLPLFIPIICLDKVVRSTLRGIDAIQSRFLNDGSPPVLSRKLPTLVSLGRVG